MWKTNNSSSMIPICLESLFRTTEFLLYSNTSASKFHGGKLAEVLQQCVFTGSGHPDVGVLWIFCPQCKALPSAITPVTGRQTSSTASGEPVDRIDSPYNTDATWESYHKLTADWLRQKTWYLYDMIKAKQTNTASLFVVLCVRCCTIGK